MSQLRGNIHQLIADQGSTVHQVFAVKTSAKRAIPLEEYIARMQIRKYDKVSRDPGPVIIAEYTTENGYLSINDSAGTITLLVPPSDTAGYEPGSYLYDLEVESPSSETTRIIQGRFIVRAEVTR